MQFIKKHGKKILLFAFICLIAAGCVRYDKSGMPTGTVYQYIGIPTARLMDFLAHLFNGSYGMAIIIITVAVRLLMLPSTYKMTKNTMESSAKMKYAQPEISEIQAEMNDTDDPKEKADLQKELMQVYAKYDINMLSSMSGCLPLLIQLPFISAVYAAIRSSEKIAHSTFLGIDLGQRSIAIVVLVVVATFLSSWLMQKAAPTPATDNPQASQMQNSMLIMNPLMLGWFTYASNAGLGVYFLAGSIVSLLQQIYMNHVARPKIQAEMEEKAKKYANLPREKRKKAARENKNAIKAENAKRIVPVKSSSKGQGRNAGKQNRNQR
ncbi:membrane protein insertase YidC [Facklamia hominis]|uniref:membrane protein insertase YidC n=1 Tax=Facklamia hominis TaxID=178214 RepID=UPI00035436A7|nr:membrane protein insertase YidC [Facklamia hominis]EPH12842.1 YidC/Oxa1 family membrane protein insertase [Facklamia hominis ACS-120-V-Sch10]